MYRAGDQWREVPGTSGYGVGKDDFNVVNFEGVETTAVRLEVELRKDFSGGILEWRVE